MNALDLVKEMLLINKTLLVIQKEKTKSEDKLDTLNKLKDKYYERLNNIKNKYEGIEIS